MYQGKEIDLAKSLLIELDDITTPYDKEPKLATLW